jgi:hypothetical protein
MNRGDAALLTFFVLSNTFGRDFGNYLQSGDK